MVLDLNKLTKGIDNINATVGSFMFEAAVICLEHHNQVDTGSEFILDGDCDCSFAIKWSANNIEIGSWNDEYVAIENGAYGIALLLVKELTKYKICGRSVRGDGFDFWLGNEDNTGELFQDKAARLEVSGILNGQNRINSRINEKMIRIVNRPNNQYDFHVIVVEFSKPMARVRQR